MKIEIGRKKCTKKFAKPSCFLVGIPSQSSIRIPSDNSVRILEQGIELKASAIVLLNGLKKFVAFLQQSKKYFFNSHLPSLIPSLLSPARFFLLSIEPQEDLKIRGRLLKCMAFRRKRFYSSNQITKKEPKSDDRLSKFDWHD